MRRARTTLPRGLLALALAIAFYVTVERLDLVRGPLDASGDGEGARVLFVGNSHTFENEMPTLLHDLAAGAGGPGVGVASYTAPGRTLRGASESDGLTELLREARWDVVVLQEATPIAASPPDTRRAGMHPYARVLARHIRSADALPALFMTWGFRDGDGQAFAGDTFPSMQERIREAYEEEGVALAAPVAPVGLAWAAALRERPGLDLWAEDGRHPSRLGSYLTACVFYVALTGRDATDSEFLGGLPAADAAFLQRVATDVVAEAGARGALLEPR